MLCRMCGNETRTKRDLCDTCKEYFKKGGVIYDLPEKGEVRYTSNGDDAKVVCHICGMAFTKLSEHVTRKHHMSDREYREVFGLQYNARLVSIDYQRKMSVKAEEHKTYEENFKEVHGNGTKRCLQSRLGQKQSLQEIESRREHQRQIGKLSKSRMSQKRLADMVKIWTKNLPQYKNEETGVESC